ncbi:MAG TPA: carboxypeptidase-like regulatory domain-containing protein [Edaphobacter sp.]
MKRLLSIGPDHHRGQRAVFYVALSLSLCGLPNHAHAQQQPAPAPANEQLPNSPGQASLGSITGIITDADGAEIPGARITLTLDTQPSSQRIATSGSDGRFSFTEVPPRSFKLNISAQGFAPRQTSGDLHPGEAYDASQITLPTAVASINMQVTASQQDIAQAQIEAQEQQRVFGIVPNFYVSYVSNPVPLTSKQKFQLGWKTIFDPVTFAGVGVIAGIQQANNTFPGYGQGAQGYGKRYAAAYGDALFGTLIGNAVLPSILKQDPRYFYKGTGTTRSRALYAIANAVICKGDNGHWQPNYSGILGSAAAGGISNLYYPAANRYGATLTIENTLIGTGGTAIGNLFQEFFIRKLTPHLPKSEEPTP